MWDAAILIAAIVTIGVGVGLISVPWALIVVGSIVMCLTIGGGVLKGNGRD